MKFQPETMVGQPSRQRSAPVPGRCNVNGRKVPGTSTRRGMLISQRPGTGALRESGIALVVTLILLAVITFLTVAFLFLSTRERGAVTTQLDMTAARLATEAAAERATVDMIASMIATTNEHNYDLFVSRNIDLNIASLFYDPRPPVFPATNRAEQFYLDLNRNRRFDASGVLGVLDDAGAPISDTNGLVLNNFVGDPEWIGLLERNDRPHSANNRFKSRMAYIIVPEGKTLDVNHIHNAALTRSLIANDGFLRNQGVGTWELNLAGALADLNTNYWGYNYQSPNGFPNAGTAFEDAQSMLNYRYGANYLNQRTVRTLFGNGATVLQADTADGYSDGNLMTGQALANDTDNIDLPWAGAENINHIFTTQDFFNPARSSANFVNRLGSAGAGLSSYNRYTFYRMLSQLGTDSGPEPDGKLHLNYVNVDASGKTVQDMQTGFVAWKPLQFFTNAADRMFKATFDNQQTNYARFGVPQITITDIPVYVSNRFVYTPSIHRILQVSANVFDASTSRKDGTLENFPSVFRPVFQSRPNAFVPSITDLFIVGYTEVTSVSSLADPQLSAPLDISDPVDQAKLPAQISAPVGPNIYGVPWVIGAKKGFPNFNEFSMQSVAETSRRLQLRRNPSTLKVYQTNQLFNLSVSNMFAFEAWNSYQSDYQRGIEITVANDMTLGFGFTNDPAYDQRAGRSFVSLQYSATKTLPPGPNAWRGYGPRISEVRKESFQIPLSANYTYLSNAYFRILGSPSFTTDINVGAGLVKGFEQSGNFHLPEFEMEITNRIRFIMIDTETRRVIDYAQIGDMNGKRKLSDELSDSDRSFAVTTGAGSGGQNVSENMFWSTNRPRGSGLASPPKGVLNQIQASTGDIGVFNWNSVGVGQASGRTKEKEIDAFRNFLGMPSKYNTGAVATNNDVQAPFTPTRVTSQYISWQANDPLVHYTAGDLGTAKASGQVRSLSPGVPMEILPNIGKLNARFEPWGGNPSSLAEETPTVPKFSVESKDPGVTSSDRWDFSTNKFASLGMLGRVHRGTPWQTLYLKSDDVSTRQWTNWTGNWSALDSMTTKPQMDRLLFDVFTAAVDANSTRGQLNVNQTNLAAWSAGLSGIIGLQNISNPSENGPMLIQDQPVFIDPAGIDVNNSVLKKIYDGINRTRASEPFNGAFKHAAEVFATPELSVASPLLDISTVEKLHYGITDATYERLPQMLIGLLRGNDQPRFTIYAYGQTLRPAKRSIITSGPDFNLCTNYQVTAEFATRTVVRIEGAPTAPRAIVESFNILPPD